MSGDADLFKTQHQVFGNTIVEHTFTGNRALLFVIKSGRIIFEVLDQRAGLRPLVKDLGLAFVDLFASGHGLGVYRRLSTQTECLRRKLRRAGYSRTTRPSKLLISYGGKGRFLSRGQRAMGS